jgi:hypothetical protein
MRLHLALRPWDGRKEQSHVLFYALSEVKSTRMSLLLVLQMIGCTLPRFFGTILTPFAPTKHGDAGLRARERLETQIRQEA